MKWTPISRSLNTTIHYHTQETTKWEKNYYSMYNLKKKKKPSLYKYKVKWGNE